MAERVPDFIIGGAPRAGTNFLCHALDRHPEIYVAKPYMPEPKVFMGPEQPWPVYAARYAAFFAAAGPGCVLGEKTTYYLENEACCALIRRYLSAVRMVFVVREPVARAYSNFLWSTKNGLETLSFEEAVTLEGQRPSPLPPDRDYARPFDYLQRGRYDVFAARYYAALGRDRVRFVVYEELVARPEAVLPSLQEFVGVTPRALGADGLGIINSAREVGPTLKPETERSLRERMAPAVRRFAALTGLDVAAWGYPA
ncbi:MAG TPA: sulfotransferase [Methylomirabilota bacterium]|nr:sulfotransferase [Methylomirabilota bacterium]